MEIERRRHRVQSSTVLYCIRNLQLDKNEPVRTEQARSSTRQMIFLSEIELRTDYRTVLSDI